MSNKIYIHIKIVVALAAALSLMCCDGSGSSSRVVYGNDRVEEILQRLDQELARRDSYVAARNARIDSLRSVRDTVGAHEALSITMDIAELYRGFLTDSALIECSRGEAMAHALGEDESEFVMRLARIEQMPLAGFTHDAVVEYQSLNLDTMKSACKIKALEAGRQMYSYIAAQYPAFPNEQQRWNAIATDLQGELAEMLDADSPEMLLNAGEWELMRGNYSRAKAILGEVLERVDVNSNMAARVASLIGQIASRNGDVEESMYYLALSAIADVRSATREVTSLQQLGIALYAKDDVGRADYYLQEALASGHAAMRMLQTSEAIPVISAAGRDASRRNRIRLYCALGLMAFLAVGLLILIVRLRYEMQRQHVLRENLENANHAKEVYMSEFISLCSVYMNKLNRFCEIASRKISTGATDELYRLTKSGRFAEEESRDFYDTFDKAFLHIHPDFVAQVNSLLREDSRIDPGADGGLNTDLRILAFVRLGVSDSVKIAQALNYSVNTIYSYRNRLRNRALNRDSFDDDIMNIG